MFSNGFGSAEFGTGRFGVGTIPQGTTQRKPNPDLGYRKFDTKTREYLFDSYGNPLQWTETQQRVYLAVATCKGSSCLGDDFGLDMSQDKITDDLPDLRRQAVVEALQPMLDLGTVEIVEISTNMSPPVFTRVWWREIATGKDTVFDV